MSCNKQGEWLSSWCSWTLVGLGAAVLACCIPVAEVVGVVSLSVAAALILLVAARCPSARAPLIVAFVLRATAALVHHYIMPLPDSQADALGFERLAAEWAEQGLAGVLAQFGTGARLYPWLISLVYCLLGRSPLVAQAGNVFFGTLIVRNVYLIARHLWSDKAAARAAWAAALFPTLVLYSAITMREVAVVFPLSLGVIYFIYWLERDRLADLIKALAACGVAVAFHTGALTALLVMAVATVQSALCAFRAGRASLVLKRWAALCLLTVVVAAILASGWGLEKVGGLRVGSLIDWLAHQQRIAARDRAAYLPELQPAGATDLIWQTPIRIAYFLYMPFPWVVRTAADLLGLTIASLNFLVTLCVMRALPEVWKDQRRRWVLFISMALLITFALTTSNYGTSARHSSKLVPLALALARIPKVKFYAARIRRCRSHLRGENVAAAPADPA